MKKLILLLLIAGFSLVSYANRYAELTIIQSGVETKPTAYFDDGNSKLQKVFNEAGKKFVSPVAVVNFFKSQGWDVKIVSVTTAMGNVIRVYELKKE